MSKADAVSFIQGVKSNLSNLQDEVFELVNNNDVDGFVELGKKSGFLFSPEEAREVVKLALEKDLKNVDAVLDDSLLEEVVGGKSKAGVTSLFSCKSGSGHICTISAECNGGSSCGW